MKPMKQRILFSNFFQNLFAKIYHRLYMADFRMRALGLRKKYQIHSTVIWHPTTNLHGEGIISIDESTYIGANTLIDSNPVGARITIGKFCAIAPNVHIRTIEYRTDVHFYDARFSERKSSDIKIGDCVWIGTNVFICGGVEIGENSVVGANSVVTHNIPPHSICAGVPARVIRTKPESAKFPSLSLKHDKNDLDIL